MFPSDKIWLWVAVAVSCACLPLVFSCLSMILGHHAYAKLICRVQRSILEKLRETPLGWFTSNGAASVRKAMNNDLGEMEALVIDSLREPAGALAGLTVSLYYMFSINVAMASIAAAALVLQLIFYCTAMRSQTMHQAKLLAAQGRIGAASVEYAEGAAAVKIFGAEGSFTKRFEAAIEDFVAAMRGWVRETRYSAAASYILASEVTIFGLLMIAGVYLVRLYMTFLQAR